MNEALSKPLADAVAFLAHHEIPFAVIGGIATSIQGEPRVTADIDLVLGIDVDSAVALLHATQDSEFEPLFDGVEEVLLRSFILPLRHRVTGTRVDMAIGLSGFERQTIQRAESTMVGNVSVPVATAEDLLRMKLLASRPRDLDDARALVSLKLDDLDWLYTEQMAADLGEALDVDLLTPLIQLRDEAS